jgi:hypothetical protein
MSKSMIKIAKTVSLLAVAGLVLSGCAEPRAQEPEAAVYQVSPLTGVAYLNESDISDNNSRPAVSCKVDNAPAGRPQFNLNKADIVHVQMVEGGLTRLVATWHSEPVEKVGPVRSVRPMDADIAAAFGGIFCYSGGLEMYIDLLKQTSLYIADENTQQSVNPNSFSRTPERTAPHNLVVDMGLLQSQQKDLPAPQPIFNYAEFLPETESYEPSTVSYGSENSELIIKYPAATSNWKGDGLGNLLRTQDGIPHMDGSSDQQVSAKNVVVLEVQIDSSIRDARYGVIPKTVMIGSGKAWVFVDGKHVEGTWSKASQNSPIELLDSTGAVIKLSPGNTWVELKPETATMTITP